MCATQTNAAESLHHFLTKWARRYEDARPVIKTLIVRRVQERLDLESGLREGGKQALWFNVLQEVRFHAH